MLENSLCFYAAFYFFFPDCWSLLYYNIELLRLIVFVFIITETYYKIKVHREEIMYAYWCMCMKKNKDMCMYFVYLKRWGTKDKRKKKEKSYKMQENEQIAFDLSKISRQN